MKEEIDIKETIVDVPRETSQIFDVSPKEDEEVREGVIKNSLDDIFGVQEKEHQGSKPENGESPKESESPKEGEAKEKTKGEVFAEVKALTYVLNFVMVSGAKIVANMMKKEIDENNINASDQELNRLAKVAQPVYEKYTTSISPESTLILAILSIYGFRIMGEFMGAADIAEKATKETSKVSLKQPSDDSWIGNKDYFQSGAKKGKLKNKHK